MDRELTDAELAAIFDPEEEENVAPTPEKLHAKRTLTFGKTNTTKPASGTKYTFHKVTNQNEPSTSSPGPSFNQAPGRRKCFAPFNTPNAPAPRSRFAPYSANQWSAPGASNAAVIDKPHPENAAAPQQNPDQCNEPSMSNQHPHSAAAPQQNPGPCNEPSTSNQYPHSATAAPQHNPDQVLVPETPQPGLSRAPYKGLPQKRKAPLNACEPPPKKQPRVYQPEARRDLRTAAMLADALRTIELRRDQLKELEARTYAYWDKLTRGVLSEAESSSLEFEIKKYRQCSRVSSPLGGISQTGGGLQSTNTGCDPTDTEASQASDSENSGLWELSDEPPVPSPESVSQLPDQTTPTSHDQATSTSLESLSQCPSASTPAISVNQGSEAEDRGTNASHEAAAPTPPNVHLEMVHQWDWRAPFLPVLRLGMEFRFVNLEHIMNPLEVQAAVHNAIQELLDLLNGQLEHGDLVQMRLQGPGLNDPLYSVRRHLGVLSATEFMENFANLTQSNATLHLDGTLRLVVTVIRDVGGCAKRLISTVLYSQIIHKKRRHLADLNNIDNNLCFGGSLLAVLAEQRKNITQLTEEARQLYSELGIDSDRKLTLTDLPVFEKHLKVNISVLLHGGKGWDIFRTGAPIYERTCYLLLHEEHFYGILNPKGFFGQKNFCTLCGCAFTHTHSCKYRCRLCLEPKCDPGDMKRCPSCKLFCKSDTCLARHLSLADSKKVDCKAKILCDTCTAYVPKNHKCKPRSCKQCREPTSDNHRCFMPPLETAEISDRYIFYDCEARQDLEGGQHAVNYIYAMGLSEKDTWEFRGEGCVADFVTKFIDKKFKNFTFIAHNSKGYDCYFIVKQLLAEKMDIHLITQGGKLMCVTVKKLGIRFIDSLNFIPLKLSKLPAAMGFQEECKGHFPHFFNTLENSRYCGPFPDKKYFGMENMMPEEKERFLKWYGENKGKTFDMQKEIARYCQQDVKILRKACLLYREEILNMSKEGGKGGLDPFQFLTLASVCMALFRQMFLKRETIALLPWDNYHRQTKRYSTPAIQWLLYLEHKEGIDIRHALKGGELQVGPYFLDGFAIIQGKPTALEYLGCFFHGCSICYNENARNPLTDTSYRDLHYRTQHREAYLKNHGLEVRSIWEHEWHQMVQSDAELRDFLSQKKFPQPLIARDALFGGRTNAITLHYVPTAEEEICYYDFTSLYPFVNKTKEYPIGHPQIIFSNFGPLTNYFGLIKAKVLPPRGLFFPVLPVRVGVKLMFPLCHTCAQTNQQDSCTHSIEQRALEGTWVSVELLKAIEKGYHVLEVYEIWHFENKSTDLFSDYIKMHLRQKQEASGFPAWCEGDEEKQAKYVRDYYEREGVQLRPGHISKNPARRQIAKLFLNSLWGKFAQRSNLPNTTIVRDSTELLNYAFSPEYDVSGFELLDSESLCVSWRYSKERFTMSGQVNVVIGAFTTAYARLELYNLLDKLQGRCLYHDTDSVIFVQKPGHWSPPLGDFLGDLTSEIPSSERIVEFIASGPKTYAYRLASGQTCLKVKGITLNSKNAEKVNFQSLKDLVLDHWLDPKQIVVRQKGIVRDKKQWRIQTVDQKKTLSFVYDKRVLLSDLTTLPYGF